MNKAKRLIIPYILIGLFYMMPIRLLIQYPGYLNQNILKVALKILIGYDNGHLWFLPALFICFICTYVLMYIIKETVHKNKKYIAYSAIFIICILLSMTASYVKFPILIDSCKYLVYFLLGYFINEFYPFILKIKSKFIYRLTLIILGSILFLFVNKSIIALALVVILYCIIPMKANKAVKYIDKNSFGIYLFHSPLIYFTFSQIPNANPLIVVFINFVIFGILANCITEFVRKIGLGFIIGEDRENNNK